MVLLKLKIMFIGLGGVTLNAHLPAIKELGYNLDICVDIDQERVKRIQQITNCKGYNDYREALRNENPDVVLIATPHTLHAQMAIDSIESGAHVYLEKPMAITLDEALGIVNASRIKKRFVVVGHNTRFDYRISTAAKLSLKGSLGKVYHAKGFIIRQRGIPASPTFILKSVAGVGAVYDIGSHAVDTLLFILGFPKPRSTKGVIANVFGKRVDEFAGTWPPNTQDKKLKSEVEDFGAFFTIFDDNVSMYVEVAWASYSRENKIEYVVFGDKGGIHIDLLSTLSYITSIEKEFMIASPPQMPQTRTQIEVWRRLFNAIELNDESSLCYATTVEQGVIGIAILESAYKSAIEGGKEVQINIPDEIIKRARQQLMCIKGSG